MASRRHESLPVPLNKPLEADWTPGKSLFIGGFVIGNRFEINLGAGEGNGVDLPLHISCRVKEGKIVLNSLQDGKWGSKEEKHNCPFKKGEEFDIRIRAHDNEFEIFAAGKKLAHFAFRQALMHVKHVQIVGEIELHRVSLAGSYYPMPFQTNFPGGFGVGKSVCLTGMTSDKAHRFAINLITLSGDIAFHMSARFDEKKVVRNSKASGAWMKVEEKTGDFPFKKGHTVDIIITANEDAYHVFVDGQPFITYKHRTDVGEVSGLLIEGDLELQEVSW